MNEMSNSNRRFEAGFSIGRGFLPHASRDPPFGRGGPSAHFYRPPPPDNYGRPPLPGNYQRPPPLPGNYQRNYPGASGYHEPPLPGPMRGPPPFHRMESPPGMMQSGYDDFHPMYGPPFDPDFPPPRRPWMRPPEMCEYGGRPWMNSNNGTWRRGYNKVHRDPPANEWDRKENWWNDAIQNAVREKKIARRNWKISRSQRDRRIYMIKKKEAKRTVAIAKARTFEAMCPGESSAKRNQRIYESKLKKQRLQAATEDVSQEKHSEGASSTDDEEDIPNLSKDEDNTTEDVSQTKTSDGVSAEDGLGNVSSFSEYKDSTTGDISQDNNSEETSETVF